MRIKTNIVKLLAVLAILGSLVAIAAVPASADVDTVTVTPAPASASSAAQYTVTFNTGAAGALTVDVSTITITFPDLTILPSSIAKEAVSVNGTVCALAPSVNTTARTITLVTHVAVGNAAAVSVVIAQTAGITNPSLAAATYTAQVYTSAESNPVTSAPYSIYPTLAISSVTGTRGASVTVTGKGWSPNQAITIGAAALPVLVGTGTALADGTFSVAAVAMSSGAVTCRDGSGVGTVNSGAATTYTAVQVPEPTYTLKASVMVSPTSGNVGTVLTIVGTDFTSGGTIAINAVKMSGVALGPAAAYTLTTRDAYSTLDDCIFTTLTVPVTIGGGAKTISVTDGTKTATCTFTVNTPTITLNPSSGAPNTMVTITGANFKAADTIVAGGLTFNGGAWNTATITVDAAGGWNYAAKVPATAVSGSNPVAATSTGGTVAPTVFTVGTRVLTVTPLSGPIGTAVTVTGANMSVTTAITGLTFGAGAWPGATLPTTDSLGNFIITGLQVPVSATGAQTVTATDGTYTATSTFTVTQPTISISPSTGYKGDMITVTGAGWVSGTLGIVMVTFAGNTLAVATPDGNGAFTAMLTVPANAAASSLVGAADINGNTAPNKLFLRGDPMISISPTSGPVGTKVTVTGKGLVPQTGLSALIIGGVPVLPTTAVITSTIGGFTAAFTVPGLAEGAQVVSATVGGTSYTTFFTITPGAASVEVQTVSISSQLVRIWGYSDGTWHMYDPATPALNDLPVLGSTNGYWFKVTETCTLVYGGFSKVLSGSDWTLVGWP